MRISAAVAGLGLALAVGLPAGAAVAERGLLPGMAMAGATEAGSDAVQQQRGRGGDPVQARGQGSQRPEQAGQQRGQGNQRPEQAGQQRGQGNQRPQQAGQQRGQGNQRPQQAGQQRGQGNQQAQQQRGQQGRGQQAAPGQQRREQAAPGRQGQQGRGQQAAPGQQRREQASPGRQGQQGRGQQAAPGQRGRGQEAAPGQQGRGPQAAASPGRSGASVDARGGRPAREALDRGIASLPTDVRGWVRSPRRHERLAAGALVLAASRGVDAQAIDWRRQGNAVEVLNPSGELLFVLDDRRARELGFWEVRRLGDHRPRGNAPAFCRSGAGHPVWGRQWCLDRGFGLGSRAGTIWSRGTIDDVVFRREVSRDRLLRDALIGVLGEVVVNRLALHSLGMGYTQPLYGQWVAEPGAPRLLHVYSGDVVVAELVDLNQNDRVDVIYVLQPL